MNKDIRIVQVSNGYIIDTTSITRARKTVETTAAGMLRVVAEHFNIIMDWSKYEIQQD